MTKLRNGSTSFCSTSVHPEATLRDAIIASRTVDFGQTITCTRISPSSPTPSRIKSSLPHVERCSVVYDSHGTKPLLGWSLTSSFDRLPKHLFNNNRRKELPELSEREIQFQPTPSQAGNPAIHHSSGCHDSARDATSCQSSMSSASTLFHRPIRWGLHSVAWYGEKAAVL